MALPQGHIQMLRSQENHLARRRRAAALDEAQMFPRDVGVDGEVELAQAALLAPRAHEVADGMGGLGHPKTLTVSRSGHQLPRM
jgi:hypothetical protein